jgi:CheY-like chemotaxis protein
LPDANGLSIVRDLRRDPVWRHTPSILLTRRSSPWDKLKAAAAGCDAYLVKPASTSVLQATVLRCIERGSLVVSHTPAVNTATAATAWAALRVRWSRLSATARMQVQG